MPKKKFNFQFFFWLENFWKISVFIYRNKQEKFDRNIVRLNFCARNNFAFVWFGLVLLIGHANEIDTFFHSTMGFFWMKNCPTKIIFFPFIKFFFTRKKLLPGRFVEFFICIVQVFLFFFTGNNFILQSSREKSQVGGELEIWS